MNSNTYSIFHAIGCCHGLMKDHADAIRTHTKVKSVTHWTDMYNVDQAFRFEEYVDAELVDGQAISWRLELTLTLEGCNVEADVRRVHDEGQDVMVEIADCDYSEVAEYSIGVLEATRKLCACNAV